MAEEKSDLKVKCPICKKESLWNNNLYRPFCSKRCSMIDLGEWADDGYQIEGTEPAIDPNDLNVY